MPLISQAVRNLCGGVSQQPQSQRRSNEFSEQVNALTYQGRLLGKRPPSVHVARLSEDTDGTPFVHTVPRSAIEKYVISIHNGTIAAYNQFTGAVITVDAPDGLDYLSEDTYGFRALSVGDQTIIVNRSVITRRGTSQSSAGGETALVVVRQGNFRTFYSVTLAFGSTSTGVNYLTPESSTAGAEEAIGTDAIASELFDLLEAETDFDGQFTFALHGSTIAITPVTAGTEYSVITFDGLGDQGLQVLKGSTQRFSDLPKQAPDGTLLEVRGDDSTEFDNYWVQYSDADAVWNEALAPGTLLGFDASTMPHLLEYRGKYLEDAFHEGASSDTIFSMAGMGLTVNDLAGKQLVNVTDGSTGVILSNTATTITVNDLTGGTANTFAAGDEVYVRGYGPYFIFREAPWENRPAGDIDTNPYPSFIDGRIRDVFVTQGRLGLIAAKSIVMSRSLLPYALFRESVVAVLPDGPIDITEALPGASLFHSYTEWNGRGIVWTDLDQFELLGDPVLTPATVALKRIASYQNLSTCRPITSGNRIFFVGLSNALPRIMEFTIYGQEQRITAESLTEQVPTFLDEFPTQIVADDTLGLLFVVTAAGSLYAFSYASERGERVQQAWGQWEFA